MNTYKRKNKVYESEIVNKRVKYEILQNRKEGDCYNLI